MIMINIKNKFIVSQLEPGKHFPFFNYHLLKAILISPDFIFQENDG